MKHYETLGITPSASPEEVTLAYRRKAKATHPDHGGSDEAFQQVEAAGSCLRDPERRAKYDATGDDGSAPAGPTKEQRLHAMLVQGWMTAADPLDRPSKQISDIMKDLQVGLAEMERKAPVLRDKLTKLQTRFGLIDTGKESNAYDDALRGHIAKVEAELAAFAEAKEAMTALKDMLKVCKLTERGQAVDREQAWEEEKNSNAKADLAALQKMVYDFWPNGRAPR